MLLNQITNTSHRVKIYLLYIKITDLSVKGTNLCKAKSELIKGPLPYFPNRQAHLRSLNFFNNKKFTL